MSTKRFLITLALAAVAGVAFAAAPIVGYDHLACWKAKDSAPKATYSADLLSGMTGLPSQQGCVVKLPAKLLCSDVAKTNVQPTPPGAFPGTDLVGALFACYKVKCPKAAVTTVPVHDQFGDRTMAVKPPSMLCAPANVLPPCGSAAAPACNGTCPPPARCGFVLSPGACVCGVG
jgi:hypothetical protein